ncbi:MAG TPA: protein kinase [Pyrinomonadaceae bacterium]|jgi:serine/threonine protein kinase
MSPEQWRRVEELFEAALALPAHQREKFLRESCGSDDALRLHVEAMLAADQSESNLDTNVADLGAAILLGEKSELDQNINRRIGNYKIIREIGRGGMGTVYEGVRDDDEFLQRVAVKLIRRGMDTDFILRRFRNERQILANLNHSFIARLYDGGSTDDHLPYFVMEYVEGESITHFCNRNNSSLIERLRLFEKVCTAAAYAHKRQIVHRDIKPGNILVTTEGEIKLLDFGIAKLLDSENPSAGDTLDSMTGRLMTPAYASPEQIRETAVTPASDVYSLGVLLFQLLTGVHPFKKSNPAPYELARAICEDAPPTPSSVILSRRRENPVDEDFAETPSNEKISPELDNIVLKALQKNPAERYSSADELAADINRFTDGQVVSAEIHNSIHPISVTKQAGLNTNFSEARTIPIQPKKNLSVVVLTSLIFFAAIVGASFWFFWKSGNSALTEKPAYLQDKIKISRITTSGQVTQAAVSPDGSLVAYINEENGRQSIWSKQSDNPNPTLIMPETDLKLGSLVFTPAGDEIYYIAQKSENRVGSLFRFPAAGGASKKVLDDVSGKIDFAPDGSKFVFRRRNGGKDFLLTASADGTEIRELPFLDFPALIGSASWSPDGKTIAFCVLENNETNQQLGAIYLLSVESGETKRLSDKKWGVLTNVAWEPDGTAVCVTAQGDLSANNIQIWRVTIDNAVVERVTNDTDNYRGISIARQSNTLVSVKSELHTKVWSMAFDNRAKATETSLTQLSSSNLAGIWGLEWTPDGKVVYTTIQDAFSELWLMNGDGTNQMRLTNAGADSLLPSVSPDNRYIVYVSEAGGLRHLWRMNVDGSNKIELTHGDTDKSPRISPDGKWVVFTRETGGKPTLAKVSIDGGEPVMLGEFSADMPAISPDGKTIAFLLLEPDTAGIAIMPSDGKTAAKIFDTPFPIAGKPFYSTLLRWSQDGKAIYFIKNDKGVSNLWSQPVGGKSPTQLSDFKTEEIFYFGFSPDFARLALTRGTQTSDVLQINLPR